MSPRIFLHVQHLWGHGHVARSFAIADALIARGLCVTISLGGPPTGLPPPAGAQIIQLPPIQTGDAAYKTLVDDTGAPVTDRLRAERLTRLCTAYDETRPTLLMTEHYPFGRRKLRQEYETLITKAKADGRPVICSVRDLIENPKDAPDIIARHYDAVLVHSDPAIIALDAPKAMHTGYVLRPTVERGATKRQGVVLSAGSGRAAQAFLHAAIMARPLSAARDWPWTVVTGAVDPANLPAPQGVMLHPRRHDLTEAIAHACLSISRAGYNTVLEAAATGTPMVLVPHEAGGQTEQRRRAQRFADLSYAAMLPEQAATPGAIARAIDAALDLRLPNPAMLDIHGAAATADWLAACCGRAER